MNTDKVTTAEQVNAVMSRINPMSKRGPLFLQQLVIDGKKNLVDAYAKLFTKENE